MFTVVCRCPNAIKHVTQEQRIGRRGHSVILNKEAVGLRDKKTSLVSQKRPQLPSRLGGKSKRVISTINTCQRSVDSHLSYAVEHEASTSQK